MHFRGVRLSERTICWRSAWLTVSRSSCRGKCRLSLPLVFSTLPFCQLARGCELGASQTQVVMPPTPAGRPWRANSLPRRGLSADLGPCRIGAACLLARLVEGDRAFELGGQALEDGHEGCRGLGGTLAGELGGERQPRGSFVQHQNRLGAAAEHEVGLPVAERLATQHRLGSIVNRAGSWPSSRDACAGRASPCHAARASRASRPSAAPDR
jgi:hypothetical protein